MRPIAICYLEIDGDEKNKCFLFENQIELIKDGRVHTYDLQRGIQFQFGHKKWMFPFVSGWVLFCLSLLFIFRALFNPWISLGLLILSVFSIYTGWEGSKVLLVSINPVIHTFPIKSISPNLRSFLKFTEEYVRHRDEGYSVLLIYHIVPTKEWDMQSDNTHYEHDSLKSEGFIHCSQKQMIMETYDKYFTGQTDLILLSINPLMLECELKLENATDRGDLFPHIYGPVNKDAIVTIEGFKTRGDLTSLMAK